MRKTLLALSALAAVAITTSAANRSEASPLVNPTALSGAIDELNVVDSVHCRPGWRHHNPNRWRRGDGCVRDGRGAVIVVPGRTRYVWRDGVRVRVGERGARTGDRTTIRSRTDVNVRTGRGARDGARNVDTRRGSGATTQGRGGERGGTMMQDRSGGAQKGGGGGVQKGGGGMQKDGGGGAQKGGQGQSPQ